MAWVSTITVDQIGDDGIASAKAGSVWVALYRVDDEYFATGVVCSHGMASLADGYLEGYQIECPLHQGSFDVRTGEPTAPPCTVPVRSFPVRVKDGTLLVEVDSSEV